MWKPIGFVLVALTMCSVRAADTPAGEDPAYTKVIEKRADDVVADLQLKDPSKAAKVRDIMLGQYRALKAWHDIHDAELRDLGKRKAEGPAVQAKIDEIKAILKPTHDVFLSRLADELTPQQVEAVKDKMTYNVVRVTYDGYGKMLPNLTDEQKAKILETLKQAREEAMDGGSSEEKHAIFGRYKGRINNYLSSQGYDLKKASKEWADRERAAKAGRQQADTPKAE
jgi:hypothetical protein